MRKKKLCTDWRYRRGDIYIANLNPFKGSEQGGIRPVLVIQNDKGNLHCPTLIIAPMTTQIKKNKQPTHYLIRHSSALSAPSMIMFEQIDTIDKCRVQSYLGRLSDRQMQEVNEYLKTSLGMEDT